MSEYPFLFPDNTVLCNFAAVERLDLLSKVLDGRGRWTEAVAREARRSARLLPALQDLSWQGWLGDPIPIGNREDTDRILSIRTAVFGGAANRPSQHLGEAQTCHIIKNWAEFAESCWISDDRESLDYARREDIHTAETRDVVKWAVKAGLITAQDGFGLMQRMRDEGRHPRMPQSAAALA
ncbi:hypothetical protein [Streptomyces sp. NPDC058622]|uniref:hypothetical protein n=1 Tax=unclassified Streptomyces TaxID=2593676 RepID=UPI00364AFE01